MADIKGLLEAAVAHCRENPTHGINCACTDRYIREIRQEVESTAQSELEKAKVRYVLGAVARVY